MSKASQKRMLAPGKGPDEPNLTAAQVPYHPRSGAAAVVKHLDQICKHGQRPAVVFSDWLDLTWATLRMVPVHAVSVLQTGGLAPEPEWVTALWERVGRNYHSKEVFHHFGAAFHAYLASTDVWADTLGEIYMSWSNASNARTGQYFTPWNVAYLMAQLSGTVDSVWSNLREAINAEPLAQAGLLAVGLTAQALDADLPEDERPDHLGAFINYVVLPALPSYKPVTICEPCVGSGVMLLAVASTMPRWMVQSGMVTFSGQDIDALCVQMCKIQLRAYGCHVYEDDEDRANNLAMVEALMTWQAANPQAPTSRPPDATMPPDEVQPLIVAVAAQLEMMPTVIETPQEGRFGVRPEVKRKRSAQEAGQLTLFDL